MYIAKLYQELKCPFCKNNNNNEDKCNIVEFQGNKVLYCKCINCEIPGESQEIKLLV